jgi:hypothetical protein
LARGRAGYPSAAELAAGIRRHLSHEPIRARPPSALYHLRKFARRHKALVATTAAFLALLLGGGAVTAWQAVKLARAERDQAVQQAVRSQEAHEALARAGVLREQARAGGDAGSFHLPGSPPVPPPPRSCIMALPRRAHPAASALR